MNILIAKTVLQSWINKEQIALFPDDAHGNYHELFEIACEDDNVEIMEILARIKEMGMIHILRNAPTQGVV